MNLGSHAGFIIAAYAITVVVIVAIMAWIVLDYRSQTETLRRLEDAGVRRRSATSQEETR
mgnify:CR=1 FL=1